ncbi:hypothetical protein GCM10010387_13510 [Streptomyces inusitatus]|uniref:Uncharacterized protein n=1 Tax=Streptomyces inusitatus TaxID=68221 RepID=A0A918UMQ5_9ACTN|nr:hypothetical protein [Streptomyces inusitatus]GGZ21680.1 hypothetical protein GCM10010387_13510 [Streptomyces inusitatus]
MTALTACGGDTPSTADGDKPSAKPSAPSSPNSPSMSTGPGKNATDQPTRPTIPPARKPALHVKANYTYKVQIIAARTVVDLPADPPPAGTKAMTLLLRVEADPPNRSIQAPVAQELAINYPRLKTDDPNLNGGMLEDGTDHMTEDQFLFSGSTDGVPMFGTLRANTVYYRWVWQFVPEKADLTGATLCKNLSEDDCIPIGAIEDTF